MRGVSMSHGCVLMLVVGVLLFGIGAITRTYMNIMINRSPLPDGPGARSTELRYKRLIKEQGGKVWPLVVTIICIPLGVLLAFAAIICNNQMTARLRFSGFAVILALINLTP